MRTKRQHDENYRYSLRTISQRVTSWLENSALFASMAQKTLEDALIKDSVELDGADETLCDMLDEPRRQRFREQLAESLHLTRSHSDASCSVHTAGCGIGSAGSTGSISPSATAITGAVAAAPISVDDVCISPHKIGKTTIPARKPSSIFAVYKPKEPVNTRRLTDRSVLRGWRCYLDDDDLIQRRGRRRYYKRVAVMPPALWQPNKQPLDWVWAPSGSFSLHLGEYVSLAGTNGYPYEIVLIRHIPPAQQCFLELVPAAPELARLMLNDEPLTPEYTRLVHQAVDTVTYKWILNGVRPNMRRDTTAFVTHNISKDLQADEQLKQRRRTGRQQLQERQHRTNSTTAQQKHSTAQRRNGHTQHNTAK